MSQIYSSTKTTRPSKVGLNRTWYLLDASKIPAGRLASVAARLLLGKNKASYSQDTDMGGIVVVINTEKIVLTGKKTERKMYFRHQDSRIGALKYRTFAQQMDVDPTRPIYLAVKGMLPKNRHRDLRLNNRLHLFKTANHNFTQEMIEIEKA